MPPWPASPPQLCEILKSLHSPQVVFNGHSVSSMIGLLAVTAEPDVFERREDVG